MDPSTNPFSALSFIVAPAVLTNACSVLSLGTSNRLARAVDRARELTTLFETTGVDITPRMELKARELAAAQKRMIMLIRALRLFYLALGGFVSAALVSLLGAVLSDLLPKSVSATVEIAAILTGSAAVFALVRGSLILVQETKIAVEILEEEACKVQLEFAEQQKGGALKQLRS